MQWFDKLLPDFSPVSSPDIDTHAVPDILEHISEAIVLVDSNWKLSYVNRNAEKVTLLERAYILGRSLFTLFPEIEGTVFESAFRKVMSSRQPETVEAIFPPHDVWVRITVFPLQAGGIGLAFKENTQRKRMDILVASQSEALNQALSGASLEEVLTTLALAVEKQAGHRSMASISLVSQDKQHLIHVAAPHLPAEFCNAINEAGIGEGCGFSGICAHRGEFVVAEDILTDDTWASFRELATDQGLYSCWSMPIFASQNKAVIGTFTVYYPVARSPVESDIHVVEVLSRTAAIVIERDSENRARRLAEQAVKQGMEELLKQRRLYETALSNTPDLVYIFDLQGRFTYANNALLTLWGKTWEESKGKTCLELGYEPWHAEMHMREIDQVIRTKKPIRGDVPFSGAQGRRIYDYIFVPVLGKNGEVEAIAGSTRDVTERKEAEESARRSEERQRLALEASHSFGIWEWDIKNDVFTADERLGALFNLTPEEAKQGVKLEQVVQYIHEDDIAWVEERIDEVVRNGDRYRAEYRIRQTDGSIRWGSFRGRVQRNEQGEAVNFPGVGVDNTLERNAIIALQEADRKKDEFLATLAHELRNPLAPIRNALHLLKSGNSDKAHQEQAHLLIERQLSQMVRLVDDLMDVSRITRGKIKLKKEVLSIEDVLSAGIETVQPIIEERHQTLQLSVPEMPLYVEGDLVRLSQIFSNLVNNAAKYTQPNGTISVSVRHGQDGVEIEVADNGAGIPEDKLSIIFEMFSQVEGGLESSQGGLGIGLTLVKQLTELHDGTVLAKSDGIGKGTSFTVCLPLSPLAVQTNKTIPASLQHGTLSLQAFNILIVDDNQDAAITMGWILEVMGCEVKVAEDGFRALEMVESFTPDIAFLDIGLPGMNGYDLCITMKKNPALVDTVFVAQTGWGQPEHIKRSQQSGFHHHLVKPVDLADIKPIIDEVRSAKEKSCKSTN